ncbi:polysulfide reductase chain A precursor [bacterium BMS3Bbin01]|nr:polysulfide reductase chain A precursor [bacterium BMS3Bbin01]
MSTRTIQRTCPLCEATCGLEISIDGDEVMRIRGDRDDVFSHGFICPKGSSLKQLHADPDRLRAPLIRRGGGFEVATWEEAFAHVAAGLRPILADHGPDAVAIYLGNPNAHNMSGPIYSRVLIKALGTKNVFTASTVDQMPKHLSSGLMFGHPDLIPVPDLDRTDYLLILGANPYASNGSLATAPDWPGRLEGVRRRGGKVVVIDPRRTRTAEFADEHLFIRPGTDALWLFAMVHTLIEEDLVTLGRLASFCTGFDEVARAATRFSPERVEMRCGIDAEATRRIVRELVLAETAVVYGRIGTHTTEFGSLAAWLVDVINALTGNLDEVGGAMFAHAAHERPRKRGGFRTGRWHSRVKELPEVRGELPVATLVDEIETGGEGQVRALITVGGNPVLSVPESSRFDAALSRLDFMVSVDLYRNETTCHADVIFPAPSPLNRAHYDFAFLGFAVRNVVNYSPSVFPIPDGMADEWETLLRLAAIATGMPPDADLHPLDDLVFSTLVNATMGDESSAAFGRTVAEVTAEPGRGPDRILDFLVRTGPYGDAYGRNPEGLTLEKLLDHPHGIDLGPLQSRFPDALATPSGKIELAPEILLADVARLEAVIDAPSDGLLLVGRRDLRSNNSWMHNLDILVKGKERCTLRIHPDDAERLGIGQGASVSVTSQVGTVTIPADITEAIMPGVVSLPHGWGHDVDGTGLSVAARRPGVNSNRLTPGTMDPLSGNAVLTAIPVQVQPLPA